jgi:hypothetical protein
MATITLSLPSPGQIIAAGLHSSNYGIIQALANGGIDNNNFAAGKIFDNTKVMQGGALAGQGLIWNGSTTQWAPAYPPGYQYDKTQITASPAAVTATTEGTSVAQITGGSVTYDGATLVKVEFWAPTLSVSAATTATTFVVFRGATVVGGAVYGADITGAVNPPPYVVAFDTPPAGAVAYALKAYVNANSMTLSAGAGGSGGALPAFLRVTKA